MMVETISRLLEPEEREPVLGDLAEGGEGGLQAFLEVLGLVARRQLALWKHWRPWLVLAGLVLPFGVLFSLFATRIAGSSAVFIWLYANNWDWSFFANSGFRHDLAYYCWRIFVEYSALFCWSWSVGFAIGSVSRRSVPALAGVFGGVLLCGGWLIVAQDDRSAPVFSLAFYRIALPMLVQVFLVLGPALWGMRHALHARPRVLVTIGLAASLVSVLIQAAIKPEPEIQWGLYGWQVVAYWPVAYLLVRAAGRRRALAPILGLLILSTGLNAADPPAKKAALEPVNQRKVAPVFTLQDRSGKAVQLKDYHGKVVLLDFWATWCTGCKLEIPWFTEFQQRYGEKGFAVVGVSLDDDGWKVLRPFLAAHQIPYTMVLGNDAMAGRYGIKGMPDTFLIDREGRIAAAYREGLVDRANIQENIEALLSQR